ncbi:MAG: BlaI/MecI/CopY family transcriptional regulator [Pirellulaceae bacterium]
MQITDAEWEVMECIWDKKDQTPAEIIERVSHYEIAVTSEPFVRCWNRLVDKGAVTVRSEERIAVCTTPMSLARNA